MLIIIDTFTTIPTTTDSETHLYFHYLNKHTTVHHHFYLHFGRESPCTFLSARLFLVSTKEIILALHIYCNGSCFRKIYLINCKIYLHEATLFPVTSH